MQLSPDTRLLMLALFEMSMGQRMHALSDLPCTVAGLRGQIKKRSVTRDERRVPIAKGVRQRHA